MYEDGGENGLMFPSEDVFADTFSDERVYKFIGQELKISPVFGSDLGVAAHVWESAISLCQYFEQKSLHFMGKRIIELGAGTGIVGILAARMGGDVTLTDLPVVIPYLQNNVLANKPPSGWPSVPPTVRTLSWGQDHHKFSSDWDLVLGADIVYLSKVYPLLLDTLVYLCKKGAILYMSSKMRIEHGTPGFYRDSLPQLFHVVLVDRDPIQNINIYQAILKPSPEMTSHRARKLVNDS